MRYVLLIACDESVVPSQEELDRDPAHIAWFEDVGRRGAFVTGQRLRSGDAAVTVRARGKDVLLSDGPFAETKEVVAGFAVIECADLDEAIEIAAGHPVARLGSVEVRPVWE